MTARIWLSIGIIALILLAVAYLLSPDSLLSNNALRWTLCFVPAICLAASAADYCDLSYSIFSFDRLVSLSAFLFVILLLNSIITGNIYSAKILYLVFWLIFIVAYHAAKYRKKAYPNEA